MYYYPKYIIMTAARMLTFDRLTGNNYNPIEIVSCYRNPQLEVGKMPKLVQSETKCND